MNFAFLSEILSELEVCWYSNNLILIIQVNLNNDSIYEIKIGIFLDDSFLSKFFFPVKHLTCFVNHKLIYLCIGGFNSDPNLVFSH